MHHCPPTITESRRQRRAIVYSRQSSEIQARENTGSTALQRDLVDMVESWDYARDKIEIIEELAVTGSAPGLRKGFARLLARMATGEVGIVVVLDASRLSRNNLDFIQFIELARRFDVLLVCGTQVIDFRDPNAEFIALVLGSNATRDNRFRIDLSQRARRKKAEAGVAASPPPVGYVRVPGGVWEKHPDSRVRTAIDFVFDKALAIGGARPLVRHLRHESRQVPRRRRDGVIAWVDATYDNVLAILKNPAYCGDYVFGRSAIDERLPRYPSGKHRLRPRPVSDWICHHDHHAPYIDRDRWNAIQDLLRRNQATRIGPAGRGAALLQRILRCHTHKFAFVTTYPGRRRLADGRVQRTALYTCRPGKNEGSSWTHVTIAAHFVDAVVEEQLLRTLAPPSFEVLTQATREALLEHDALCRAREDELHGLETAAAAAERAFNLVSSDHPHLLKRQATRCEEALAALEQRRASFRLQPLVPPLALTETEWSELKRSVENLSWMWHHPTFTNDQRKMLLRTAITAVFAEAGPDAWILTIHWAGGATTAHTLATDRGTRMQLREAFPHIWKWFSIGRTTKEIARDLNAAGLGQARGPWTDRRVKNIVAGFQRGAISGYPRLPVRRGFRARARALHEEGLGRQEILQRLHAEGAKTLRHRPVTLEALTTALRSFRCATRSPANEIPAVTIMEETDDEQA